MNLFWKRKPKLKHREQELAHAVLVIAVQLVHQEHPEETVAMAPMANQVNQAKEETQPHRTKPFWTFSLPNAHAKPHLATKDHRVQKVRMVVPEMPVGQVEMVNRETKVREAHQVKMANRVVLVRKVPMENLANRPRKLGAPEKKVDQENPAPQVPREKREALEKTAGPVVRENQEEKAPLAEMANQEPRAPMENQENKETLAAALIAHLLVWPLVIKRRNKFYGATIF